MPSQSGPFVGRDGDLARLAEAAALAGAASPGADPDPAAASPGGGRAVLAGDAGIGKSRLLAALTDLAAAQGRSVLVGHCVGQAGCALAYLPFVEIVGTLAAQSPDLLARVQRRHPALARLAPHAGDPDPGPSSAAADHRVVAEAVHTLLTEVGRAGPTLVIVEDVHWADHSSRDLLTLLLTRGFPAPVSLVVSYRSDDLHRRHPLHETLAVWARLAEVTHLELAPLAAPDVERLLAELPDVRLDPPTAATIVERAEGNPFFVEELAAAAAAGRPTTGGLRRVLAARFEQLDEQARLVVGAIAVAGRDVPHDLLAEALDVSEAALDAGVRAAIDHQVLVPRWPAGYTFRHALLAETVLDDLLPGERLRLHRRYAAVLAARPALGPASELARHAAAAGDLPTAVTASRAAAAQALAIGGAHEALEHLERALDLLGQDGAEADEITLAAAEAAMASGSPLRAVGLLRDRLEHPGSQQNPGDRASLMAAYAMHSQWLDLPVDRLALTSAALALLEPDDQRRLRVLVAHVEQLVRVGDWHGAADLGDEAIALAEQRHDASAVTEIRAVLTRMIEATGGAAAAEAQLGSLLSAATAPGPSDPLRIRLLFQLASSQEGRGDLAGARARFDEGAQIARALHLEWLPWGMDCRLRAGLLAYLMGDWAAAADYLTPGQELAQPGRALFDAALLAVTAGRGEPVDPAVLAGLRQWWLVDGLVAVLTAAAGIDLLAHQGDLDGALELAEDALSCLDRTWGSYHAVVRLAALAAGAVAAAAPRLQADELREACERVEVAALRAERLLAGLGPARPGRPEPTPLDPAAFARAHPETWAWGRRLGAELARLRWHTDRADRPSPAELVAAWQDSVAAFERYGHVYESARSLARLAQAQLLAGDRAAYRGHAQRARELAASLGAAALRAELDALEPTARAVGPVALTPREMQVLQLVARGRSNGQIGQALGVATKTVSVHVSNLLAKLGAASRTEAAALARERGLLG